MATNYENQKGFYENVKLDENGYMLVTGISGGGGATGPAGTSGTSGVDGTSGTSGVNGSAGESGTSGTSGVSPEGGGVISITNTNTFVSTGATAADNNYSMFLGNNVKMTPFDNGGNTPAPGTGMTNSILMGMDITGRGEASVVIGSDLVGGGGSVIIGYDIQSFRNWEIQGNFLIGNKLTTSDPGQGAVVMLGQGAQATSDGHSIVVGGFDSWFETVCTMGRFGILIGTPNNRSVSGINIGYINTSTGGDGCVVIGRNSNVTHTAAVVLGNAMSSVATETTHVDKLYIKNTPVYADNDAALAGGLVAGQVYRTSTGVLMITYAVG